MSPLASFPATLKRIFGSDRAARREITERVYDKIVAAARQSAFYAEWGVPDTPLGRYEMVAPHLFLVLHRLRGESEVAGALAQDLTDNFFTDLDHSIRELGVGDLGVPKRMKKLAGMFYGRATAYGEAVERGDVTMLSTAFARNIRPGDPDWPSAAELARYALAAHDELARQPVADFVAGRLTFPLAAAL